jgi:hypothetical protein
MIRIIHQKIVAAKWRPVFFILLSIITRVEILVDVYSQGYQHSPPVLLYSDEQMDEVEDVIGIRELDPNPPIYNYDPMIDQSWWALKDTNGIMRIFNQWQCHMVFHEGSISQRNFFDNIVPNPYLPPPYRWCRCNDPVAKPIHNASRGNRTKTPPLDSSGDICWTLDLGGEGIPNIYKIADGRLLGLVHIERVYYGTGQYANIIDRYYAIGIAYSENNGMTWEYCGDVVLPYYDELGDTFFDTTDVLYLSNIGGVPYIINGEYLYIYFNESIDNHNRTYPSMARAPLQNVINDAEDHTVTTKYWKKFSGGTAFDEDPIIGLGARLPGIIIPSFWDGFVDLHSDATYCTYTGNYLLTVNYDNYTTTPWETSIVLYSSINGIDWNYEKAVAGPSSTMQPIFPSFISEFEGATDDDHEVGREFYIMYAGRRRSGDTLFSYITDLYATHVNE